MQLELKAEKLKKLKCPGKDKFFSWRLNVTTEWTRWSGDDRLFQVHRAATANKWSPSDDVVLRQSQTWRIWGLLWRSLQQTAWWGRPNNVVLCRAGNDEQSCTAWILNTLLDILVTLRQKSKLLQSPLTTEGTLALFKQTVTHVNLNNFFKGVTCFSVCMLVWLLVKCLSGLSIRLAFFCLITRVSLCLWANI